MSPDAHPPATLPGGDARIAHALEEIERRIGDPPSVEELARLVGLRPSRFTRLFRDNTAETPASYARRRRLIRAREAVESSDTPLKVIAFACGFRDAAHFSRAYFALYGAWPSDHRRAMAAVPGPSREGEA